MEGKENPNDQGRGRQTQEIRRNGAAIRRADVGIRAFFGRAGARLAFPAFDPAGELRPYPARDAHAERPLTVRHAAIRPPLREHLDPVELVGDEPAAGSRFPFTAEPRESGAFPMPRPRTPFAKPSAGAPRRPALGSARGDESNALVPSTPRGVRARFPTSRALRAWWGSPPRRGPLKTARPLPTAAAEAPAMESRPRRGGS